MHIMYTMPNQTLIFVANKTEPLTMVIVAVRMILAKETHKTFVN